LTRSSWIAFADGSRLIAYGFASQAALRLMNGIFGAADLAKPKRVGQNLAKNSGVAMARVLLVGYDPETGDYSNPALPPGMSAEKIRAGLYARAEANDRPGMGGRSLPRQP
jgi:hypothetical protein